VFTFERRNARMRELALRRVLGVPMMEAMSMSAIGFSLLFVAAANLLIGAVALLPVGDGRFARTCLPVSAALAALGAFTLAFAAAS
jgi:hypothetical protein